MKMSWRLSFQPLFVDIAESLHSSAVWQKQQSLLKRSPGNEIKWVPLLQTEVCCKRPYKETFTGARLPCSCTWLGISAAVRKVPDMAQPRWSFLRSTLFCCPSFPSKAVFSCSYSVYDSYCCGSY